MRSMRSEKGFTLMELMVVIVIVAILAAVAVPLYINYVKDAQRTEAKGAIGAIVTAEQVFYQKSNPPTYTDDSTKINVDLSDVKGNWTFTLSPGTAGLGTSFKVVADGVPTAGTKGLQVTCEYERGKEPKWEEK